MWQPIESAPRDGTDILLVKADAVVPRITVGCWDASFHTEWDEEAEDTVYRGAWTDYGVESWGYEEYQELHPTHWMPLPAPPADGE